MLTPIDVPAHTRQSGVPVLLTTKSRRARTLVGACAWFSWLAAAATACADPLCDPLPPAALIADWSAPGACDTSPAARYLWAELDYPQGAARATGVAANEREVFVSTIDGVWRRPLDGSATWSRLGLQGRSILSLLAIGPSIVLAGTLGAVHRTTDAGAHWCSSGSERFVGEAIHEAIPFLQLVRDPGAEGGGIGLLYAGVSGSSIAFSRDAGATWGRAVGEQTWSIGSCALHVAGGAVRKLYRGCDVVDRASISDFDLSSRDGRLGEPTELIAGADLGYHHPTSFASSAAGPDAVYAGLSGGVIKLSPANAGVRWIYRSPDDALPGTVEYTNVQFVWIDPCKPTHLVFGGPGPGSAQGPSFDVHETADDGTTTEQLPSPLPDSTAWLRGGAKAGLAGRDLVVLAGDASGPGFKVLRRYPGP